MYLLSYNTILFFKANQDYVAVFLNSRWLGPKRYEISGAKTWLSNKGYEGKITFVLDETNPTNPTNLENRCLHRCTTCEEMSEVLNNMNAKVQDKRDVATDKSC